MPGAVTAGEKVRGHEVRGGTGRIVGLSFLLQSPKETPEAFGRKWDMICLVF